MFLNYSSMMGSRITGLSCVLQEFNTEWGDTDAKVIGTTFIRVFFKSIDSREEYR